MNDLKKRIPLILALLLICGVGIITAGAAEDSADFTDIPAGAYYEEAANWCRDNGIMGGTSESTFSPDRVMSRAMLAAVLYRAEGSPAVSGGAGFPDVADTAYYAQAAAWASANGIIGGYSSGLFGSDDPVTREQIAAILYRYAQHSGRDVSVGEDTNILSYEDAFDISEYAIPAMQWAAGAGIIGGNTASTLDPKGSATRAQVAAILYRYFNGNSAAPAAGNGQETANIERTPDPDIVTSGEELAFPIGNAMTSGFTGAAYLQPLIMNDEVYNFPQTNVVTFEPGARSGWHTHGEMILLITGGVGYYQEEGKPAQILRKGDVVECAPGVNHWHGAAPDSWFSQVVIYDSQYVGEPSEGGMSGPVTDEYYANLETEEYTGRVERGGDAPMFPRAPEPVSMGTFNGPVYLSSVIGAGNVAGAPELHYVVFEPGVINNWHIHEGGQILIATDGIGYHQIEGQPVEVLRPGDVALCPPGVKHWHGGSADTSFAHIAVNTNPELTGLQWFDSISEEEYAQLSAITDTD